MARRNLYEVSDLIQFALDNGHGTEWNDVAELVDDSIDVRHEIPVQTFTRPELMDESEEHDPAFVRLLLAFMDSERLKKQVTFTRG